MRDSVLSEEDDIERVRIKIIFDWFTVLPVSVYIGNHVK